MLSVSSATRRAISMAGTALAAVVPVGDRRTFTPSTTSRFSWMHRMASSALAHRKSSRSGMPMVVRVVRPRVDRCTKAYIRVSTRPMT